ncbi:oligomeric complex COG6-domain-containing protein [Phakopsora pachyrhizi]|uniref:Conserved oligomeric Golgi complex subunit 6 n=1 Tax=Phakopsora pachyrhizi TaxID=170000 RepID=A0AAV0AW23_PHAPC|nr:oligomeric complex COG6-domain-containing protein [Phakopsora pachyrhizi]
MEGECQHSMAAVPDLSNNGNHEKSKEVGESKAVKKRELKTTADRSDGLPKSRATKKLKQKPRFLCALCPDTSEENMLQIIESDPAPQSISPAIETTNVVGDAVDLVVGPLGEDVQVVQGHIENGGFQNNSTTSAQPTTNFDGDWKENCMAVEQPAGSGLMRAKNVQQNKPSSSLSARVSKLLATHQFDDPNTRLALDTLDRLNNSLDSREQSLDGSDLHNLRRGGLRRILETRMRNRSRQFLNVFSDLNDRLAKLQDSLDQMHQHCDEVENQLNSSNVGTRFLLQHADGLRKESQLVATKQLLAKAFLHWFTLSNVEQSITVIRSDWIVPFYSLLRALSMQLISSLEPPPADLFVPIGLNESMANLKEIMLIYEASLEDYPMEKSFGRVLDLVIDPMLELVEKIAEMLSRKLDQLIFCVNCLKHVQNTLGDFEFTKLSSKKVKLRLEENLTRLIQEHFKYLLNISGLQPVLEAIENRDPETPLSRVKNGDSKSITKASEDFKKFLIDLDPINTAELSLIRSTRLRSKVHRQGLNLIYQAYETLWDQDAIFCQAIPTVVLEGSCIGTIHVDSDSSNTLSLIRDVHQAFYTDNLHSQYHSIASRSFENVARELCMIVFGSPLWQVTTCLDMKDDEANSKCLKLAVDLNKHTEKEPVKIAATWNRGFNLILTILENS